MTQSGGSERVSIAGTDLEEDRFSRFRLISWWDQERLREANVLVIGAGALGNEILKNLALLGVRRMVVVDLDRIEYSNLSRSVLFRAEDVGTSKALRAAASVRDIAPDTMVHALDANVLSEVGLGLFSWADVILAGLDNREARLWINRCAWKVNRPWIDGAIEGLSGVARVFLPGKMPCYECTLGETDWAILERRLSCNLLTREEMAHGKTPTTPTTSSVIAGIQVQEAVKLLHGLPVLAGKGYVFEGLRHSSYLTSYSENPDCMSHVELPPHVEYPGSSTETTLEQLHEFAALQLGAEDVTVEFSRDIIQSLVCPRCDGREDLYVPVGSVSAARGRCPRDGTMREVVTVHSFSGRESFGGRKLSELGLPRYDLFLARAGTRELPILLNGDREAVLGPLAAYPPTIWEKARSAYATGVGGEGESETEVQSV
jgi:adenylyltransferase/sulfurtransferase